MSGTVHNLVSGSATGTGWTAFGDATIQTGDVISVTTSNTSLEDINAILTAPFPVTYGKSYTLTADIKTTTNFSFTDGCITTGMVSLSVGIISISPILGSYEWGHISVKLTPSDGASDAMVAFLAASTDGSPASLYIRNLMLVEGTTPAAWAPADGETLAGGGAPMSANLWNTSTQNLKPNANGVYTVGKTTGELNCTVTGTSAFAANQTVHMGASLRGADKGCLKPFVEYKNAAGNLNWVGFQEWTPTSQWQRFEATCVVPSGMTPTRIGLNTSGATGDIEVANPVFSYSSPLVLAVSSTTLAWSAGILATVRYYQLAAPTAATPTVPTSSSSLGSWTETEPTADVTKVLWTCERTVYADGTESWSKASKSTSYEAAKDAQSTATDAQEKATALSTLIRQTDAGVEVGKSADGKTYTTNRALMSSAGAFQVLDKGGSVLANFDEDSVELGGEHSTISLVGGQAEIYARKQDTLIEFGSEYIYVNGRRGVTVQGNFNGNNRGVELTLGSTGLEINFTDLGSWRTISCNKVPLSTMYSELLFKNWSIPMAQEIVTSGSNLSSFDFLDVVCKTNDGDQAFTRVYAPVAGRTTFVVSAAAADGASDPAMWIKSKRFQIKSEHHINCMGNGGDTPWKRGEGTLTNHTSTIGVANADVINICEIVGWRYVTGVDGSTLH